MTRALLGRFTRRLWAPKQHLLRRHVSTSHTKSPTLVAKKKQRNRQGSSSNTDLKLRGVYLKNPDADMDVTPSTHVTDVASEHDIGFPISLKRLVLSLTRNPTNIQVQYSSRHVFDRNDMKWLDSLEHPFAGSVLDRYIEWSDGSRPLWWSVGAWGNVAPFVCTTAQRRLKRGIRLALEERGYDQFGRRLVEYGQKLDINNPLNLVGTLRINCSRPKEFCQLTSPAIFSLGKVIIADAISKLMVVQSEHGPGSKKKRWIPGRNRVSGSQQQQPRGKPKPTPKRPSE